jgi:hypothetical protein
MMNKSQTKAKNINKQQSNNNNNKNKQSRRRRRRKDNYSFLNFSNSGDILSNGIGKTRAAPVASGRALATTKPEFSTSNENTLVCHSEYITDILQQENFTVTEFSINPGLISSFTWLSSVAPNYERYRFRRLRFRYEVLSSTNTTGKVFFVPNFNVQDPPPENKAEALSYEYAVGSQPWIQFGVSIPKRYLETYNEYFVRTGMLPNGADIKTYDVLNLYICTEGATSNNLTIGEFWIDYEIELVNPVGQQAVAANNYLTLYNSSLAYALTNTGVSFGSNSQFPLGASGSLPTKQGGLKGLNIYPNDTGTGSVLYFTQSFTGLIFFQWGLYNAGVLSDLTWPPTINYSTIQTMVSGSPVTFLYYTDVVSSGNLYIQAAMLVQAAPGSQFDFSLLAGASANSIQSVSMLVSPMWLSLLPPVFPSSTSILMLQEKVKMLEILHPHHN